MGANGSSLVGCANVHVKLMQFTAWGKDDIDAMQARYRHELGARFALGPKGFASLIKSPEKSSTVIFNEVMDTDKNGLVDALECMASFSLLSRMTMKDKMDMVFSLYDFNGSGRITIDELTILLRTVTVGAGKMDTAVQVPSVRELEELSRWAFSQSGKDVEAELEKHEFDAFCLSNPKAASFLDYWTGNSNQVVIPPGVKEWTDTSFDSLPSSLYLNPHSPPPAMLPHALVSWLPPSKFCPATPKLFAEDRQKVLGSVKGGALANRWFLNALSLVAHHASMLRSLFVHTGQEQYGRYAVRFFKEERWRTVDIDHRIPSDPLGRPLFSRSPDPNELWPMIVEKAYAKLHGCYQALIGGTVSYALRDLTGGRVSEMDLRSREWEGEVVTDRLWAKLMEWVGGIRPTSDQVPDCLLGCVWTRASEEVTGGTLSGVQFNAMHSVLRAVEFKQFKLLQVRNPWGGSCFNGEWSDGSKLWQTAPPDLLEAVGESKENDMIGSSQWMTYEDFVRVFDRLFLVKTYDPSKRWTHHFRHVQLPEYGGGSLNEGSWVGNPQFYLKVEERSSVELSFTQPDPLLHGRRVPREALGLVLCRHDWGNEPSAVRTMETIREPMVVLNTETFVRARDISATATLEPGKYVVIPMAFRSNSGLHGWLSVFSQSPLYPVKLYSAAEVRLEDPSLAVEEGTNDLDTDCKADMTDHFDHSDPEPSNDTLALASLSLLLSKMWALTRQLDYRKETLAKTIVSMERSREAEIKRIEEEYKAEQDA